VGHPRADGVVAWDKTYESKPDIIQDRDRIRSKSFAHTLRTVADFIFQNFIAIINEGRGSATGDEFEDKAAVGFSWIPSFVKQYETRLRNNTWPRDEAVRQLEAATSRAEVDKIKTELTFESVSKMSGVQMKQYLDRISYRGRSKLRVKDGPMLAAMCKAFDLKPAAAPA